MITMKDIKADGSTFRSSLSKLVGKKIKDVHGIISAGFGDPVFKLSVVVFEDDTVLQVEGEHDFPYLVGNQPNYDEETLYSLYSEEEDN